MEKLKKAKSRQELADELSISRWTLNRWLKKAGIRLTNGLLSPKEQELIFQEFGSSKKELFDKEQEQVK
ncbi:MAG: hypothetical protein ACKV1O_27200 [Saprospiraceae bacterium]